MSGAARHEGPCALAIGGLDPGGGAGILADLRALYSVGVFGCAAVALVTVQSTDGLVASYPIAAARVVAQAAEVVRAQHVHALKLGALGSVANVRAIARWVVGVGLPIVLDPVMLPTRGSSRLLTLPGVEALRDELLPLATVVAANAPEAATLSGLRVTTVREAIRAARKLLEHGPEAVLVKGGHLVTKDAVVDVLALRTGEIFELPVPRIDLPRIHGGGCVLASLIAGHVARAASMHEDVRIDVLVRRARRQHQRSLAEPLNVGGIMRVLVPRPGRARPRAV